MSDLAVSVVVPVYNAEAYIGPCVRSIMAQTYKNMEIILVNDGSTDSSGDMCEDFAKTDPRITVIHKENGGLGSARNAGIDRSTGDFLAFADSDDFLNERMIEVLVDTVRETGADAALCGFQYYYGNNIYHEIINCAGEEEKVISGRDASFAYFDGSDAAQYYIVAWNKLYRRALFKELRYPEGRIHEDEDVTLRLLYQADRIALSPFTGYYYRVEKDDSIMGNFSERRFELFDAYITRMEFYAAHEEKTLWQKTLLRSLHMLEQYIQWKNLAESAQKYVPESADDPVGIYRRKLLQTAFSTEQWISGRLRFELKLFDTHPKLYQGMWETMNRRRKRKYGTREFLTK